MPPSGPGSVREQIKMINEKFAGAAGSQWQNQEPYPSLLYVIGAVLCTVCTVTAVFLLNQCVLVLRGEMAKNSWEISLEDPTRMPSVTPLRKIKYTQKHGKYTSTLTNIHKENTVSDTRITCVCAGWTTWPWTVMKRWTTVRWTR